MREWKDSGVEWIGEIPQKWNLRKIKNVARFINGDRGENYPSGDDLVDEGVIFLSSYNIGNHYVETPEDKTKYITEERYNILGGAKIQKDDIVFCLRGSVGKCSINKVLEEGTIASSLVDIRSIDTNADYLLYYLQSPLVETQTEIFMNGTCAANLSAENVGNYYFIEPSAEEQVRIIDYLDSKCSQIDEIISKQEQIIEKLKDYKLSVITDAVTKGLDDVEMKDSGIDLCDKIPSHWNILQNRYLFSLRDEKNYKPLEEVNLLSLYTDLGVFPHGEQEERGNKAVKAEGYKVVYEDDIIVNIILAWMGAIGRSSYYGVTSPAYDIYKPERGVCSRFYHYLYRTRAFSAECYKYGRGIMAMRWRTYSSEFKSIKVPVPPYDEQCKIADYLDEKCRLIEKTITDRQESIEKLKEYKKSLIYEVVTGKMEV